MMRHWQLAGIFCALQFIYNNSTCLAQSIKSLTVGDQVPNIKLKNIINFSSIEASFLDFKNRLVIIDFWGTTCSSCIAALPKLDSIQRHFKKQVQILTVSDFGTEEQVERVFQRLKLNKLENSVLPVILNSSELQQLFPHKFVSHVVWIDGNGVVKAITGTEYITTANIKKVLSGDKIDWPVKKDVFEFNYNEPFLNFSQRDLVEPQFMFSSAFTGYMEGVAPTGTIVRDSAKNTFTRSYFNHTLLQMCIGSLYGSGSATIDTSKLILHVKDPTRYIINEQTQFYGEWARKNVYCYSYTVPVYLTAEERSEFVKRDLTNWLNVLGITVKKENEKYVITEKGK